MDQASSTPSLTPSAPTPPPPPLPAKSPHLDPSGRRVGFARPTLIIPPPQAAPYRGPYSASLSVPPTAGGTTTPHPHHFHYMYPKRASEFMFSQFNGIRDFTYSTAKSGLGVGEKCSFWLYNKIRHWSKKWFTHIFLTLVVLMYTVGGALLFVYIEGENEKRIVEGDLRKLRYVTIDKIRSVENERSEATTESEVQGNISRIIEEYEKKFIDVFKTHQLIVANNGNDKIWTFWNAVVYCGTIYTTIGYGHMYPTTTTGMVLTIVYAIIGIPLFLIALTDFGKLFTRCIKFVWSFVRRLYYTGSCKRVRKTAHVQEIFKGAQMMYEIATFRRPSQFNIDPENPENQTQAGVIGEDTPTTPALSNFEIDDEFNLPISVAIFILVVYIFLGALIYCMWEHWDFFASFYFVFISMSTIGFGDYVPRHPICMIVSIIYLVFGLALMSMCINVVQEKLSDTFRQASAKIGATIGLKVSEDDGSITTVPPEPVEVPEVHNIPNNTDVPKDLDIQNEKKSS